jgi:Tfp pilus assembly protein PilF
LNQKTKIRYSANLQLPVAVLCIMACAGCQALHPFTAHTKAKLASARSWANGGLEALQAGHLQQAQGFFQRATEQRPNDFRSRANLARAHFQAGEFDSAAKEMRLAVLLSDNDPFMVVELGQMQLAAGDPVSARQQAEKVLKNDRQFVPAWILQGKISRHEGDFKVAMVYLHKAAGLAPENLDIQMELAKTYQINNEPLKALAAIDHLLSRHPIDAQPEQAILTKANLLVAMNQNSTAIATLRRAMTERSTSPAISTRLVQLQLDAGQTQQANQTLDAVRQEFPESEELKMMAQQIEDILVR